MAVLEYSNLPYSRTAQKQRPCVICSTGWYQDMFTRPSVPASLDSLFLQKGSKNYPPQNCRHIKSDVNQFKNWGPTNFGATLQNLFVRETWLPEFVHPCPWVWHGPHICRHVPFVGKHWRSSTLYMKLFFVPHTEHSPHSLGKPTS